MSARDDYLRWRSEPAVGCTFARLISRRPRDYGEEIAEIPAKGSPARIAATIERRIAQYVADPSASAAALLMPDIKSLEKLAQVTLALRDHTQWVISSSRVPGWADQVAVHVARRIPFGETTLPSEALILAPFANFPRTRQSPVLALQMYVGEPMSHDPVSRAPSTKAHLAHIDLGPDLQKPKIKIDNALRTSRILRRKSLGLSDDQDDFRAKAKVAFVIPDTLARQLGCEP